MRQKRCIFLACTVLLQAVTSALRLQHIDVVLVGPQYASNVGQALRLCACFEVGRLKLVAPEYDRDADATYERRFAMPQGRAVRDERTIVCETLDEALEDVEFSVAFSGRGRADASFAAAAPALAARVDSRTALVFGREADGLRAEELTRCGTSVEIASADSLNLSHAVAIALADIYARAAESEPAAPDVAPDATVDALVSRLGAALGADEGFRATSRGKVSACVEINVASMAWGAWNLLSTQVAADRRLEVARRVLRRAAATSAEVGALHGVLGDLSA